MERIAERLDALRRGFLRPWASFPWLKAMIRDRSARVCSLAIVGIGFALAATVIAPLWLLLCGPLLLGIPHLIADLRYLAFSPTSPLPKPVLLGIFLPLAAMTLLRLGFLFGLPSPPALEVTFGLAALLAALGLTPKRRSLGTLLLVFVAFSSPFFFLYAAWTALALGHLHNVIAFAAWLALSKNDEASHRYTGVALLYLGCIGLLLSGTLEPLSVRLGAFSAPSSGLDFGSLVQTLAPGISPTLAFRLVLVFAFAQAVHYTVWLRLIPNSSAATAKRGPTSFREDLRDLRTSLGSLGTSLALGLCLLIPCLGLWNPVTTRSVYLSLVLFHGWMEIAIFAHLLARSPSLALSSDACRELHP